MEEPWVLITGGAKRVGAEIARQFHQAGFNVAIHYLHSKGEAQALVDSFNLIRCGSAQGFQADLSCEQDILKLADEVKATLPSLTVLVNNASVFKPMPLASVTMSDAQAMLQTNLLAPYFLSRELGKMLAQSQGSVLNLVDIHGQRPLKDYGLYSIAKAGLEMATRSLALEMAPDVRVNGIAPGAIIWPHGSSDQKQQAVTAHIPLGRCGQSGDIAQLAVFLAQAPYISGQVIAVDGGRSATGYLGAE